jgi:hypothetical protein
MTLRLSLAAGAFVLASSASFAACDRESLNTTIDSYFAALQAHDAGALSLARDVKFTEDGVVLRVGEGFWQSAGAVVFSRDVLDTETCGTVTMALVEEEGRNIIVGVRLKLDDANAISEIEHIIAREMEFAFRPEGVYAPNFINWEAILTPEERTSRAAMVAAANDYFDMFVGEPEVSAPFSPTCHRWENGTHTTRNGNCSPKGLTIIHGDRRVPVVDRETGVAVAFVHFARSLPDMHMFKFRSGHVEYVQSVIGPRAESMGWPDDPSLSRRAPPEGEQMSRPLNLPPQTP